MFWSEKGEEIPCNRCGDTPAFMHGMCDLCDYLERSAHNYPPYEMFADGMATQCSECGVNPARIRGYCSDCDPPGFVRQYEKGEPSRAMSPEVCPDPVKLFLIDPTEAGREIPLSTQSPVESVGSSSVRGSNS